MAASNIFTFTGLSCKVENIVTVAKPSKITIESCRFSNNKPIIIKGTINISKLHLLIFNFSLFFKFKMKMKNTTIIPAMSKTLPYLR